MLHPLVRSAGARRLGIRAKTAKTVADGIALYAKQLAFANGDKRIMLTFLLIVANGVKQTLTNALNLIVLGNKQTLIGVPLLLLDGGKLTLKPLKRCKLAPT